MPSQRASGKILERKKCIHSTPKWRLDKRVSHGPFSPILVIHRIEIKSWGMGGAPPCSIRDLLQT